MSITLTLYNQSSPTNKINKNLGGALGTAIANPNGTINVLDPIFIIDSLDAGTYNNLGNCNYLIAGAPLNRRYFVVSVDFTIAKTAIVICHCDVLSTYASQLGTLNFIRGAGDINEMDDSSYPISDYMVQQYYPMSNWTDIFHNTGSNRQYLLRTIASKADVDPTIELNLNQLFWMGETFEDGEGNVKYKVYYIKEIKSHHRLVPVGTTQSVLSPGTTYADVGYYLRIPETETTAGVWQMIRMPLSGDGSTSDNFAYKGSINI